MDSVYITIRVNAKGFHIELIGANGFPVDEQMLNLSMIDAAEKGAYEILKKTTILRSIAMQNRPSTKKEMIQKLHFIAENAESNSVVEKRRKEWYQMINGEVTPHIHKSG